MVRKIIKSPPQHKALGRKFAAKSAGVGNMVAGRVSVPDEKGTGDRFAPFSNGD